MDSCRSQSLPLCACAIILVSCFWSPHDSPYLDERPTLERLSEFLGIILSVYDRERLLVDVSSKSELSGRGSGEGILGGVREEGKK